MHRGIDFASITPGKSYAGADILAAHDGVVVEARGAAKQGDPGWVNGFGSWVWLRHLIDGQRVDTIYGHMPYTSFAVKSGDTVTAGQKLAEVGSEGDSSGPHLHFEVWPGGRLGGVAVDPEFWLPKAATS